MRKWLTILLALIPITVLAQASWHVVTVPYKADNLNFFTGNGSTYFSVTLTGNVNTSGLNGGSDGMETIFHICQDNVGGHTFNWPPNVSNPPTINAGANACTDTRFVNVGNFTWNNTGVANGTGAISTPPGGSPIQTQVNNGGVFGGAGCESFANKDTGPENVDCDWHSKGLNPYVDVTRFGVRAGVIHSAPFSTGVTATTTATQTNITVSTSTCAGQAGSVCFINGDGVLVYGAGSPHNMTTPSAPTVIPSISRILTGMRDVVNGPTGSTSYQYQVFAEDRNGGLTAASSVTAISTGASSLGPQNVGISACSRANDVVTCTTSSAHGLTVGTSSQLVVVIGAIDRNFNGWWSTSNVADSTHFSFVSSQDTRNGAPTSTTLSSALVFWFQCNHVTWGAVTGAYRYWIVGRTSGSMSTIGVSWPNNPAFTAGVLGDLAWDDFGSPMTDGLLLPAWVPSSPPGSATSDHLSTTVVSGAGTTTLILANAAGTSVSGAGILVDSVPGTKAAVAAANVTLNRFVQVYFPSIPSTADSYPFNSFLDLTGNSVVRLMFAGTPWLRNTIALPHTSEVSGSPLGAIGPSGGFAYQSLLPVIISGAYPGFHFVNGFGCVTQRIQVASDGAAANQNDLIVQDGGSAGAGATYREMAFISGANTDYLGIELLARGASASGFLAASINLDNVLWNASQFGSGNQINTATPGVACTDCGVMNIRSATLSGRGMYEGSANTGGTAISIYNAYYQGGVIGSTPFLTVSPATGGGSGISQIILAGPITLDTSPYPLVSILSGNGVPNYFVQDFSFASLQGSATYSGRPSILFGKAPGNISPGAAPLASLNREVSALLDTGSAIDGIFNTTATTNAGRLGLFYNDAYVATGPGYGIFVDSQPVTNVNGAVSAGGSVPSGPHTYAIAPVWSNNGFGTTSQSSPTVTTSPGNQTVTVTWTTVPGNCKGYVIYRDNIKLTGSSLDVSGCSTGSYVDSQATPNGGGITLQPSGGPTMLLPGVQGIATPTLILSGAAPITGVNTAPGVNVVSGYQNSAYDNFNRANGAIGANYAVPTGSLNVSSNTVVGASNGANNTASWSATTYHSNQFSQATVVVAGSEGVVVRASAIAATLYVYWVDGPNREIGRYINGSFVSLNTVAGSFSSGDLIRLEISGTNLTAYRNGTVDLTATDGGITSGQPGILIVSNGTTSLDNWSGGNLHPIGQLDTEQDWTQPQHFGQPVTIGATNPVSGALPTGLSLAQINLFNGANVTTMTATAQNATGNPLISTSSTPSAKFLDCQNTSTCAQASVSSPLFFIKGGPVAMAAGTVAIGSLPFASSTSYVCTVNDVTAANPVQVVYTSGATVTFNGTTTDSLRYICWGI